MPNATPNPIDLNQLTPEQRQSFVEMMNNSNPPLSDSDYSANYQADSNEPQPRPFEPQAEQFEPTLEQTSKHWSKSKTMWFNMGVTALGVASSVLPFAKPFIKPKHYGLITTAIGVGNMALRAVTKEKIHQ